MYNSPFLYLVLSFRLTHLIMNIQIIQSLTMTTDIEQLLTEYNRAIQSDLKPLDNSISISINSSTANVSNEALLYIAKVNGTLAGCISDQR
ncbi:hypothetical protein HMPREF9713_02499 [Myroides odoratimimus CCUG 12700]|nr:hypothetical protein HMPREF9713_02499 [Myroides odoratimimus CCUG 12700]